MNLKEKYKNYRKKQVELHTKILDEFVNGNDFKKSAETLGMKSTLEEGVIKYGKFN